MDINGQWLTQSSILTEFIDFINLLVFVSSQILFKLKKKNNISSRSLLSKQLPKDIRRNEGCDDIFVNQNYIWIYEVKLFTCYFYLNELTQENVGVS